MIRKISRLFFPKSVKGGLEEVVSQDKGKKKNSGPEKDSASGFSSHRSSTIVHNA